MELNKLTISQAHRGLIKKDFSAEELTRACFERINKREKDINAFITTLESKAIKQAQLVDKQISTGLIKNILQGIPLAIKDNILISDIKTTAGSKMLENYIAVEDSFVIKKLRQTGAIFLGKTNMDEFAMGSSTEASAFGPTKNPLNTDYVPGGSSGGSVAAVVDNMCLGALGTDTGGSIRQPASFCGAFGIKPTYGAVSRYGLLATASSLDQIGVIAKSVDDMSIMLATIEGKDVLDSTSVKLKQATEFPVKQISLKGLRIGLPKEYFLKELNSKIKAKIEKVVKKMEDNGAEVIEVSLPHTEYALAVYYIIMPCEVSSNLSRYDGIKYGFSVMAKEKLDQSLLDVHLGARSKGFGPETKRRIMLGTYALSSGYYDAYYLKAQKVRTLIKKDFDNVFSKNNSVDCLITPTSPTTAFALGSKTNNPLDMYLSDIYTVPTNLAGLPCLSMPCGIVDEMPVGLQIIGDIFKENKILQIAKSIEKFDVNN